MCKMLAIRKYFDRKNLDAIRCHVPRDLHLRWKLDSLHCHTERFSITGLTWLGVEHRFSYLAAAVLFTTIFLYKCLAVVIRLAFVSDLQSRDAYHVFEYFSDFSVYCRSRSWSCWLHLHQNSWWQAFDCLFTPVQFYSKEWFNRYGYFRLCWISFWSSHKMEIPVLWPRCASQWPPVRIVSMNKTSGLRLELKTRNLWFSELLSRIRTIPFRIWINQGFCFSQCVTTFNYHFLLFWWTQCWKLSRKK